MLQIIDSSLKQRFKPIFPSRALNCHLWFTLRGGVDDTEQNHFTLSQLFVYFDHFKKVTSICNIGTEVQKIFSKSNIIYKMFILQVTKKKAKCRIVMLVPKYYKRCCIIHVLAAIQTLQQYCLLRLTNCSLSVNKAMSKACIANDSNFRLVNSADKYQQG